MTVIDTLFELGVVNIFGLIIGGVVGGILRQYGMTCLTVLVLFSFSPTSFPSTSIPMGCENTPRLD